MTTTPTGRYRLQSTPIPSSPNELATVVARIDDRTRQMSEVHLPRLEAVATEAKDGVIDLKSRVRTLEESPDSHECDEKGRQVVQDEKLEGLSSFRNWLIGTITIVVAACISFVVITRQNEAETSARVEAARRDLDRHESVLRELPRKIDIEGLKLSIEALPSKISPQPSTSKEIELAVEKLPLSRGELQSLKTILARVKGREEEESKNEED